MKTFFIQRFILFRKHHRTPGCSSSKCLNGTHESQGNFWWGVPAWGLVRNHLFQEFFERDVYIILRFGWMFNIMIYHVSFDIWMMKDVERIDETPFLCFHMSTRGLPRMTMIFTPSMSTFRRLKWMRLDTPCQRLERNDGFDVENDFKGDRFELCSISTLISHISYIYDIYHIYLYHIIWYLSHLYNIPTFAA